MAPRKTAASAAKKATIAKAADGSHATTLATVSRWEGRSGAWVVGPNGLLTPLDPKVEAFLAWMCNDDLTLIMDRGPRARGDWGFENHVAPSTIQAWHDDPPFRWALEQRFAAINVHPTKVQRLMETVYNQALAGDLNAAKLYLSQVEKLVPRKAQVQVEHAMAPVRQMSDEELHANLRAALALVEPRKDEIVVEATVVTDEDVREAG